ASAHPVGQVRAAAGDEGELQWHIATRDVLREEARDGLVLDAGRDRVLGHGRDYRLRRRAWAACHNDGVTWLLVHSPFLGPAPWRRVREELEALGEEAVAPDLRPAIDTDAPTAAGIAAYATAPLDGADDVWLAVHSGAGSFVPAIAAACPGFSG